MRLKLKIERLDLALSVTAMACLLDHVSTWTVLFIGDWSLLTIHCRSLAIFKDVMSTPFIADKKGVCWNNNRNDQFILFFIALS